MTNDRGKSEHCKYYIKKTEKRLWSYNDLKAKMNDDKLELEDMESECAVPKSSGIISHVSNGETKQLPEELRQLKSERLRGQIRENLREINRLDRAMQALSTDIYSEIIRLRYIDGKTDEYVAEALNCDVSTVRRNRKRLLTKLSIRLYGAAAMNI